MKTRYTYESSSGKVTRTESSGSGSGRDHSAWHQGIAPGAIGGAIAGVIAYHFADGKMTFGIFIVAYMLLLGGLKGWSRFVGLVAFTVVASFIIALCRRFVV